MSMLKVKQGVLIVAMVCFLGMAMEAVLIVHLLGVGHHEEHDFGHCSICKQMLALKLSHDTGPQIQLVDIIAEQNILIIRQDIFLTEFHPLPTFPRAPPLSS